MGGMTRAEPPGDAAQPFRVSFVCTGNICRSPMAEVVLRSLAERAGLGDRIAIESAATGDWHVGEQADQRTIDALERRGYDGTHHRARQFDAADFPALDLVVAFDRGQARILRNQARGHAPGGQCGGATGRVHHTTLPPPGWWCTPQAAARASFASASPK